MILKDGNDGGVVGEGFAVMVEVAPPSLREGEDFSATPVIPADAGIQGHKNNRLPRAALVGPVRLRGSGVVCFTLGSRVRGNDVAVAGMTEVSPE